MIADLFAAGYFNHRNTMANLHFFDGRKLINTRERPSSHLVGDIHQNIYDELS